MASPVEKIKGLVARLGALVRRKGDATSETPARRIKLDPVQLRLRLWLVLLVVSAWGVLGKISYDLFAPHHPHAAHDAKTLVDRIKEKAVYPWTKGYTRGHDIVEPEVSEDRGLAAAIDSRDLKVVVGSRYIEFRDIEAVVRADMGSHTRVLLSITFEVNTYAAEQEVLKKETQIRELVAAVLAKKEKGVLNNFNGVADFKRELLESLKLVIRSGPVTDVLITT
ncbi:MAG TPA: flagellar basal body-associated FliL family protein [Bdellovibrionota bacterium]|jgi:hypothetical protein|nr:flagellar basal body-associated FliL family protein [Bdellovibrionota bacterium]